MSAVLRATAGPLVAVRDLRKSFEMEGTAVHALRGVTFDVAPGEFVAITGASGSGKTTLLDILGCLSQPTGGVYELAGRPTQSLGERSLAQLRNEAIGFVFQSFNLLPRMSVLENVALPLVYAGVRPAERRARAAEGLERVGLGHRLSHWPNQLSGGQMQRVAVARALVTEPLLVLADEPTGNLDSVSSRDVMELFDTLHRNGRTILLVTHDAQIARHAPRVLRLSDGRLAADERRTDRCAGTP